MPARERFALLANRPVAGDDPTLRDLQHQVGEVSAQRAGDEVAWVRLGLARLATVPS